MLQAARSKFKRDRQNTNKDLKIVECTAFSNLIWTIPMGNFISVYLTTPFSTSGALKYKKREVNPPPNFNKINI